MGLLKASGAYTRLERDQMAALGQDKARIGRLSQGSGKLLRLLRILVDKSKSHGQFWSETTRKASGQIVSGQ